MKTLADIVAATSAHFSQVTPETTVSRALTLMAGHKTGAVLVQAGEDATVRGIFTEQDLVRCHTLFPDKPLDQVALADVMTPDPVSAQDTTGVDKALEKLLAAGIRHLPVVDKTRITGLLLLEDLVKAHLGDLSSEIAHLQDYIHQLQDAAHD